MKAEEGIINRKKGVSEKQRQRERQRGIQRQTHKAREARFGNAKFVLCFIYICS